VPTARRCGCRPSTGPRESRTPQRSHRSLPTAGDSPIDLSPGRHRAVTGPSRGRRSDLEPRDVAGGSVTPTGARRSSPLRAAGSHDRRAPHHDAARHHRERRARGRAHIHIEFGLVPPSSSSAGGRASTPLPIDRASIERLLDSLQGDLSLTVILKIDPPAFEPRDLRIPVAQASRSARCATALST
jgi:hypothetical protein